MALNANAIITAIRDVCLNGHGNARTIATSTYFGELHEALTDEAKGVRSLIKPRIEGQIIKIEKHEASPPDPGNISLLSIEVDIKVVRAITGEERLSDGLRDTIRGLAANDGDVLRLALGWPGNLNQTASGTDTGLVSGRLEYVESEIGAIKGKDDFTSAYIETLHTFTGVVRVEN